MLSAVIIILREVLEASLIISILLGISQKMVIGWQWMITAIGLGILGSGLLSYHFDIISEWFDGVGQEVSNACLLWVNVLLLVGVCTWLSRYFQRRGAQKTPRRVVVFFISIVGIAITREGAEIFVYGSVFSDSLESFLPILIGGCIGAGIGASIGALIYHLLINLPERQWFRATLVTIMLIAAGMSSQVALNLTQADWMPSQMPLWDTSSLLPETSILGQLLYATLGYEATPTTIQVGFYLATIVGMVVSVLFSRQSKANTGKLMAQKKKVVI